MKLAESIPQGLNRLRKKSGTGSVKAAALKELHDKVAAFITSNYKPVK